jgi:aryl sulfotransferase
MDSRIWVRLTLKPEDVVISTFPRSGTTWMQQILAKLLHGERGDCDLGLLCPWVESPFPEAARLANIAKLASPRVFKSHMPFNGLKFCSEARYVYVARDGRDVALSHYALFHLGRIRRLGGMQPLDIDPYFREWLDGRRTQLSYFDHVRSWWAQREAPNVLLMRYADLKADLIGQMARICEFLELEMDLDQLAAHAAHCSFAHMKANAQTLLATHERAIPGAANGMIHLGETGRWKALISAENSALYEARAAAALGADCAAWLEGQANEPAPALRAAAL